MELLDDLRENVIRNFMEILILAELNDRSMSGYDIISLMHRKFGILFSSGTIYSKVYGLERNGLIKGLWDRKRRNYVLTETSKKGIKIILAVYEKFQSFLKELESLNLTE